MKCNKCGYELDEDAIFCTNCGEKIVVEGNKKCPSCGRICGKDDKYCQGCGLPIDNQENDVLEQIKKEKIEKQKKLFSGLKNVLSSKLALIILIIYCVVMASSVIANITSSGIFSAAISAIVPVIIFYGMVYTYLYAKNDGLELRTNSGLNLVKLGVKINLILICILTGFLFVILTGACTCATIAEPLVGVILAIPITIMYLALGFVIFYYWKAERFVGDLETTLSTGINSYKKHFSFVYVVQIIFVVFSIIGLIVTIAIAYQAEQIIEYLQQYVEQLSQESGMQIEFNLNVKMFSWNLIIPSILSTILQVLYVVILKNFDNTYNRLA